MKDRKVIRERAIRDAKSNLILDAARHVFSEKGYHETRLEDIAAAAGFSKASLYNYYEDKEKIFLCLANRDFDELLRKLKSQVEPDIAVLVTLRKLLKTALTFFGENFAFMLAISNYRSNGNLENCLSRNHRELVQQVHRGFTDMLEIFISVLMIARKRDEISSCTDERALAGFIASLLRGIIFEWKINGRMGDVDKAVDDVLAFAAGGLGCKPAKKSHAAVNGELQA